MADTDVIDAPDQQGPPQDKPPSAKDKALVDLVRKRWRQCDDDLVEPRRHYWLNYAFYRGQQWLWWDSTRRTPNVVNDRTNPTERVRITFNQIGSRVDRIVGRLAQKDLYFDVAPTAVDDPTLSGAALAKSVLSHTARDQDWETHREQTIYNSLLGASAGISIDWDADANPMYYDSATGGLVGEGQVRLTSWSLAEFALEPGARNELDAHWWVGCRVFSPDQVQDEYNLKWKPRPDAQQMFSPLQRRLLADNTGTKEEKLCAVYYLYERKHAGCKEGRVVVVCNETVVFNKPWPFPFDRLNIQTFVQRTLPNSWYGYTILNDARPLQVAYNCLWSAFIEHSKLAGNARFGIPVGSVPDEQQLTDEPGEFLYYYAEVGKPEYFAPPGIQRSQFDLAQQIEAKLDEVLYSHEVARGVAPGDRNSGLALSVLAERNDTPMGPMARRQARGWANVGRLALLLYEHNATETRKAVVPRDSGIPMVLEWNGDKLHGQNDVSVPMDVALPQSPALMQARLAELNTQFPQVFAQIEPTVLARLLGLPKQEMIGQALDDDANKAMWENDQLSVGNPIMPQTFEDHGRHIAEHNRERNAPTFMFLPQEIKQLFDAHIQAHQRYQEEELAKQAQLNAMKPGLAAMPQADEPVGSAVPTDYATQMGQQGMGMGPGAPQGLPVPGGTPSAQVAAANPAA